MFLSSKIIRTPKYSEKNIRLTILIPVSVKVMKTDGQFNLNQVFTAYIEQLLLKYWIKLRCFYQRCLTHFTPSLWFSDVFRQYRNGILG